MVHGDGSSLKSCNVPNEQAAVELPSLGRRRKPRCMTLSQHPFSPAAAIPVSKHVGAEGIAHGTGSHVNTASVPSEQAEVELLSENLKAQATVQNAGSTILVTRLPRKHQHTHGSPNAPCGELDGMRRMPT